MEHLKSFTNDTLLRPCLTAHIPTAVHIRTGQNMMQSNTIHIFIILVKYLLFLWTFMDHDIKQCFGVAQIEGLCGEEAEGLCTHTYTQTRLLSVCVCVQHPLKNGMCRNIYLPMVQWEQGLLKLAVSVDQVTPPTDYPQQSLTACSRTHKS